SIRARWSCQAGRPHQHPRRRTTMTSEHPARLASQRSMAAVEAADRDGWLALFADGAIVEDPIGVSPLDPEGNGRHGKDEIAAFYDSVVAANPVRFEIASS